MALKDLRLGIKLGFGFGLVLVMTAGIAGVGLWGMDKVDNRIGKTVDAQRIVDLMSDARAQEKNFILHEDAQAPKQAREDITALIEQARTSKLKFTKQNNRDQMDRIVAAAEKYDQAFQSYVVAHDKGAAAEQAMIDAARTVESVSEALRVQLLDDYRRDTSSKKEEHEKLVLSAVESDRVVTSILQARRHEKNFQIRRDRKYIDQVVAAIAQGEGLAKAVRERESTASHREAADKVLKELGNYRRAFDQFVVSLDDRKALEASFEQSAQAVKVEADGTVADEAAKRGAEMSEARQTMLGGALLALLVGAVAASFVTRYITRAIAKAVEAADKIAAGDLTARIESDGKDEIGQLLAALSRMNGRLAEIVGQVRNASLQIASASAEIASGNEDLARRTTEQSANLEETAASMEELTRTVQQTTDNTARADQLAAEAHRQAELGTQVVKRAMDAMGDLEKSSHRIADIIGLIDEIAFQTNVLALNAAVEAARAGEEGRGFAVVATEVRALAQRSAAAAREISSLINDSLTRVAEDAKLVGASGRSLHDILGAVDNVTEIVARIADASRQQATGIEQTNVAITQIDQISQKNATLVESAATAARELDEQSQELEQMMSQFKLASGSPASDRSPALHSLAPAFA